MWFFSAVRAVFRKVSRAAKSAVSTVQRILRPVVQPVVRATASALSAITTFVEPVTRRFHSAVAAVREFRRQYPRSSLATGLVLIGLGIAGLAYSLTMLTLPMIGFTVIGVAADSLAAAIQSYFYGGFTNGIFSQLQSIGTRNPVCVPIIIITLSVGAIWLGWWFVSAPGPDTDGHAAGTPVDQKAFPRPPRTG